MDLLDVVGRQNLEWREWVGQPPERQLWDAASGPTDMSTVGDGLGGHRPASLGGVGNIGCNMC